MASRHFAPLLLPLTLALSCAESDAPKPEPAPETMPEVSRVEEAVFHSKVFEIDQIYPSMKGPRARQKIWLGDPKKPELLWITGYRSRITDPETGEEISPEFMCHSNLSFADQEDQTLVLESTIPTKRLFTLSQGQMEVIFPEGFGIPVTSTRPFSLGTQVLNLNPQDELVRVNHETTVSFIRDEDLDTPMRPLFQTAAQSLVAQDAEKAHFGVEEPNETVHGPGCSVGLPAGKKILKDRFGQLFAAHWVVEPGRHVTRTLVTEALALPFDTTAHFIAIHLHPFAESLELRDLTTGETVFKSSAIQAGEGIGLSHVETHSSELGIPLFADHGYELVATYNNTSDENQDAMAVMFLYADDKAFQESAVLDASENRTDLEEEPTRENSFGV